MDEFVPVILGVFLGGALIWYIKTGWVRAVLSGCAVIVAGLTATVFSGEYRESWIYLLLDLGDAALGLAAGFAVAQGIQRSEALRRKHKNYRYSRDS